MASTPTRLEWWTRGLVAALAALSLVIIWTAFLASTLGERQKAETLQGERLQRSAGALALGLSHVVGDSRLALDFLTAHIKSHPDTDPLRSAEFLTLVDVVRERSQDLIDLRGLGQNGLRVTFGEPPLDPPVFSVDRQYYLLQLPYPGVGFYIDTPVLSRVTGKWTLVFSQAVPPHRGDLAVLFAALEFPRLNELVETLSDPAKETVSIYRDDGAPLYRYPLPGDFPKIPGRSVIDDIRTVGLQRGLLGGKELRAFEKVPNAPAWIVVSRPASAVDADWERWFQGQLVWVWLLTLAIVGSTASLLVLLGSLSRIRLKLEQLARSDPLTGLLNRRAFLERCDLERTRAQRNTEPLCLLLLDLDHFKQVNDKWGHQEGDRVLKDFAAVLLRALRTSDAVARIGGEEFAAILPATDLASGRETAERVRAEVETIALPQGRQTTSLGLAVWDGAETFDLWYQRADQALYRAKAAGRNRIEVSG